MKSHISKIGYTKGHLIKLPCFQLKIEVIQININFYKNKKYNNLGYQSMKFSYNIEALISLRSGSSG